MTDHDEITRLWSEDELDKALRSLHAEHGDSSGALAAARVKVLAAASGDPVNGAIVAASTTPADECLSSWG